jgi:A/G-specific adenine glycosylase
MNKREKNDIWHGLFDFPLIESSGPDLDLKQHEVTDYLIKNHLIKDQRHYRHLLTHQQIYATFYQSALDSMEDELSNHLPANGGFYSLEEIEKLPKPGLIDKYLKEE